MKPLTPRLLEHIEQSRMAVEANKAKGNRHGQLLSVMYTDSSRFVDELLQNAEDALRRKNDNTDDNDSRVVFRLFSDRLEFYHRGIDFDEKDLIAITTFANSTKTGMPDINLIGKFGIGFKSVFSICDSPVIHSAGWVFSIEDFELLVPRDEKPAVKIGETLLILPFRKDEQKKSFRQLHDRLSVLSPETLLFLRRIRNIEIHIQGRKRYLLLSKNVERCSGQLSFIRFSFGIKGEESSNYVLYESLDQQTGFAFAANKDYTSLKPAHDTLVYNGLPGYVNTGLGLYVNAPFTTSPTRELISLNPEKVPENTKILFQLGQHYVRCLNQLRKMRLISPGTLLCFPLGKPHREGFTGSMISVADNSLHRFMSKGKNILTTSGSYAEVDNVAFSDDDSLMLILGISGIKQLFRKQHWALLPDSEEDRKRVIDYYTNSLNLTHIDWEKFCFILELYPAFLNSLCQQKLKKLYRALFERPWLWNEENSSRYFSLRKRYFIRTKQNSNLPPFDDKGQLNVFLPSGYPVPLPEVHPRFLADEVCAEFFRQLGIRRAEARDIVEKGIIEPWSEPSAEKTDWMKYSNDLLILQKMISADSQLLPVVFESIFTQLPFPLTGTKHSEVFQSLKTFQQENNQPPQLSERVEAFTAQRRNAVKKLFSQLTASVGYTANISKDEEFLVSNLFPEIVFEEVAFVEWNSGLTHGISEPSSGQEPQLMTLNEQLLSPLLRERTVFHQLAKKYLNESSEKKQEVLENYEGWDFVVKHNDGTEYYCVLSSNPSDPSFLLSSLAFRKSWEAYAEGKAEMLCWFCPIWNSEQLKQMLIVRNPLGKLLSNDINWRMKLMF